ncbi:MAG: non-heme iron oxygenase ferredoxin subunit [Hyphomicrobiales bacterium]
MTQDQHVYYCLGPADEVAPGTTKAYQAGGHGLVVSNCDGEYFAIEDRCTHDNGPLGEGTLIGCQIECPRHGARFDMRSGRATALPAVRPVASYPLRVVDGELEIQLPA